MMTDDLCSQEQLELAFNNYLGATQGRKVDTVVLDTHSIKSSTGLPEWQSRIRYIDREGQTVERKLTFIMNVGMPKVLVVSAVRYVPNGLSR